MKRILLVALLFCSTARADTIKQVAQELKADSVLSMSAPVSLELAGNLLNAQAASPWLNSLDLSIAAVLRAIGIYDFPGGPKSVTDSCCPAVWAQSNIAIDPNAGAGLSPAALDFGEVSVSTPEPSTILLFLAGLLWALAFNKEKPQREYPDSHPFRKGAV